MLRMLVVDDDPAIARMFRDLVSKEVNARIDSAPGGREALEMIRTDEFDIAVVDVKMPDMDGMQVLVEIKKIRPEIEVVMLTGHGSIETAVQAMKLGAIDYIAKPFKMSQIMVTVDRVRKIKGLLDENRILKEQLREKYCASGIIGMTPAVVKINELIDRVRNDDCTLLVMGESGTGKELIARAIHFDGRRKGGPFIPIDCASIHKNLLESELFGHEKGSFTGAHAKKTGLFVKGNGGTVFLDEIGELPLDLQPTLLRAIEEKKVRPVGGTEMVDIDIRMTAATNRNLEEMIEEGTFRRDLFYRLNVVMINVPPLRERKDDIPLLLRHFVAALNRRHGKEISGVHEDALHMLLRYDWPGNVRELEHVLERAFVLGKGRELTVEDLPPTVVEYARKKGSAPAHAEARRSLEETETEIIVRTLEENDFDTSRTAQILKIDRSTVYRKLKRSNISIGRRMRARASTA